MEPVPAATPTTASDLLLRDLSHAARRGDWDAVTEIAASLPGPQDAACLGGIMRGLNDALMLAKAARADMGATATRLNAVAMFQETLSDA